jgi:hypothetical protein
MVRVVRKRRWFKGLMMAATLLVVVLLTLTGMYLCLVYRPSAYDPRPLTAVEQEQLEDQKLLAAHSLYNQANDNQPFTLTLEQTFLNGLLRQEDTTRFLSSLGRGHSPFQRPQVSLVEGRINLMGEVTHKGIATIITIGLQPEVNASGELLFRMVPPKAGVLPIPESVLGEQLGRLARALRQADEQSSDRPGASPRSKPEKEFVNELRHKLFPALEQLVQNRQVALDPVFTATPEGRRARLTGLDISSGRIDLRLQPLPK